jgi:hypothetical protein
MMAYRKRTAIIYKNGRRRRSGRVVGKGPKHYRRTGSWWGNGVFNINWLFGRGRTFKRK